MSWQTGLAVYFVIWWISLFMVLPWGVRRVDPADLKPGEDPGSPAKPHLLRKFAATSVLAGVFFGIFYWLHESGLVTFRQ
jgi:predicted secreted protein